MTLTKNHLRPNPLPDKHPINVSYSFAPLEEALRDPTFTPPKKDLEGLVNFLTDKRLRGLVSASILRMGLSSLPPLLKYYRSQLRTDDLAVVLLPEIQDETIDKTNVLRAELLRLICLCFRTKNGPLRAMPNSQTEGEGTQELQQVQMLFDIETLLQLALMDPSSRLRREALIQLNKWIRPKIFKEEIIHLCALHLKQDLHSPSATTLTLLRAEQKALAHCLARLGDLEARSALQKLENMYSADLNLLKSHEKAEIIFLREESRKSHTPNIMAEVDVTGMEAIFFCRKGIESLLLSELNPMVLSARSHLGRVDTRLKGPLSNVFKARTFLDFAFRFDSSLAKDAFQSDVHLARAISDWLFLSPQKNVFQRLTSGKPRFSVRYIHSTTRPSRSFQWDLAKQMAEKGFLNDPRCCTWEIAIDRTHADLRPFLFPRGLIDPRFQFRQENLPASSHPTLAAALALVGKASEDDVVWDPFVGAGNELYERAILGPYTELVGTDISEEAIKLAKRRLASFQHVSLFETDARFFVGVKPNLILTNPPMGRRIQKVEGLHLFLGECLAHIRMQLKPGGHMVWLAPLSRATKNQCEALGFQIQLALKVDLGGFDGELIRMMKPH